MIESFGDRATEDIYHGINSKEARRIPRSVWGAVQRKLDLVEAAVSVGDLKAPPANHLEALRGQWKGFWSIRVNDQYRLTFRFSESQARDVSVVDYH